MHVKTCTIRLYSLPIPFISRSSSLPPSSFPFLSPSPSPFQPLPATANAVNLLGDVSHMSPSQLEDMGIGLNVGIQWEEALHAALMPVTPQCSMGSLSESE